MTGGIFAILDDISMLMDDAAAVTKIAVKKTVPILGDDLAVSAEQSAGFHSSRELPVLWAIIKGSLKNKLIILPLVFLLNFLASWIIPYVLIIGGLYLSYEGAEKIYEFIEEKILKKSHHKEKKALDEKAKIKSAIITDFVLSIEIIVLAMSSVLNETFFIQVLAVSGVALFATFGVYGTVAFLVRMDDMGFYLIKDAKDGSLKERFGKFLVASLPKTIKLLSIVGTVAMLVVAGGILVHNVELLHHMYEENFHNIPSLIFDIVLGLIVGFVVFFVGQMIKNFNKGDI